MSVISLCIFTPAATSSSFFLPHTHTHTPLTTHAANRTTTTTTTTATTNHSRLFPADRDAADKSGNPPPGTVVDAAVCSPTSFDFYLTSHASLTGQTKGAHYSVCVDESGFSGDGVMVLTYWLTYLFARCTK